MENKKLNDNELEQVSGGVDDVFDVKDGFGQYEFHLYKLGTDSTFISPTIDDPRMEPSASSRH